MKTQQTLEPVHVRTDHPIIPGGAAKPVEAVPTTPDSNKPTLPAQPVMAKTVEQNPQPKTKNQSSKSGSNNVTAAITATVFIVLGLAALAVFAYIKTQK